MTLRTFRAGIDIGNFDHLGVALPIMVSPSTGAAAPVVSVWVAENMLCAPLAGIAFVAFENELGLYFNQMRLWYSSISWLPVDEDVRRIGPSGGRQRNCNGLDVELVDRPIETQQEKEVAFEERFEFCRSRLASARNLPSHMDVVSWDFSNWHRRFPPPA